MGERDSLILVISSALALVGLLLVFMPFFADLLKKTAIKVQLFWVKTWLFRTIPLLIGLSGLVATLGLFSLWGWIDASAWASWLLILLIWLIFILSILAVIISRI